MNSTVGSRARSTRYPPPLRPLCNTQIRPTTRLASGASIRMVPGLTVANTALGGAPSALAIAGRPSPMGNGFGIPPLAGLLPASSLGVGHLIITAVGSLTRVAEVG